MIRKPDCTSLQLNPLIVYVSSSSIFNSAKKTLIPLTVTIFGENCFRKVQRKVSWDAPVGTRVLRLKDFIRLEDPASLRLRNTPWRKYFRLGAKSDYLVLRKSLLGLKENTLRVELAFPVGSKNASGNKQVLVARLEMFIDKNANSFANKVDDVNDNSPKFESSSYSKVIPEDTYIGDTVLDVRARDLDTGSNADIRYSIINNSGVNSAFAIGQSSGSITIDKHLDRETVQQYSLTVQARDGASPPKTGQATVRITVTDVNDCVPQFSKREYSKEIPENIKTGELVLTVSASDKDFGTNGEVIYSFSSGNDQELFSINRLNGQIKVNKELDYEYNPLHTLFVIAQDKGESPNYNETSVEIYLTDVNDNAPQFSNSDFQEMVSERESVGHTFTRVTAYDEDDGTNREIIYNIVEPNLPFGINSQTGDLYLTRKLDRETVNQYVFHVKAEDKGQPPMSSQTKVTVNVGDINDNPPRFSKSVYFGDVEENARFGTTVLQVTATDPDLGQATIFYSLQMSNPSQGRCFRISGNGVITLSCRLDFSKARFYSLTVKARDSRLESSADVRINVTDSNTHKPVFQQRIYRQRISEATAVDGRVLVVKATDNDQGLNAKLTYAIEQSLPEFKINSKTGEITVSHPLDRETTSQYRFEVSATDHGNPPFKGTANVHITVTDVNDNKPRFLQSNYGKSILENVRPGTRVLEVSAVDDDEGSNKAIVYLFAKNGDGGGAFQIDSNQGVIRTLLPLDRETTPEYELTVVAADKGRPAMKSSVKVKITLEDVRDSKPKFEKDPYIVFLDEDARIRSKVVTVKAVSQDLVEGGDWDMSLNRTTGYLALNPKVLVNTLLRPVQLMVRVSDGKNSLPANGKIFATLITPQMLNNSFNLDVHDVTIEEFFDKSYEGLVKGIASAVKCEDYQVRLFNIKSEIIKAKTLVEDDISNLRLWVAVYKNDRFSFYNPQYVRDMVYIKMAQISKMAKVTLLPFKDGLCVTEMCNGPLPTSRRSCLSHTDYTDKSSTYSSLKVVFHSVGVQTGYRCPCAPDYRGEDCDTGFNLCYSNPCRNNGKCVSVEEGYSCICNPGRTGVNCEIDLSKSKCPTDSKVTENHLKANPCHNDGGCKSLPSSGFTCQCKDPNEVDDGSLCQLSTRSFKKGSFIAFPALKQRWRLHIQMEFATTEHSGLLLFNGRYDGKHDFIAVEVWQGQVQFRFSLFSRIVTVTSNMNGGVIDGNWHKVEVAFQNRTGIIIVDDCKLAVAVNFGTKAASFPCAAAKQLQIKDGSEPYSSLDLTGPLLLGGLLQLPVQFPVLYRHFTGCIRNVFIDHKFLDLAQPLYKNGTSAKCKAMANTCAYKPCERGKCFNILGSRRCECPSGFDGSSCETGVKYTERFLGQSFKKVPANSKVSLPWSISMRFRTAKPSGTLLETSFSSSSSVLELVDGKLSYNYDKGVLRLPHIAANDTQWHHIDILWTDSSLNITVDYIYKVSADASSGKALGAVKQFFIGARKNSTKSVVFGGFRGCIQGISVGSTEINMNSGDNHNTISGCEEKMGSHCVSNSCPNNSTCREEFDSYKCICPVGYVGKLCVRICSLKPCRHGKCESVDSKKGFRCVCPQQYTGEFCEVRMELPCPDKYFGASSIGVCGPCKCEVGMNLSPVCDKSTGECFCNAKHYRKIVSYTFSGAPVFSDGCFRCDCAEIGSTGEQCATENGQCPCLKGRRGGKDVVGRRCNQCEDKQGQIVSGRGCVGTATRFCHKDDGWQKPSLLDCVSNSFFLLQQKLANLTSGNVDWNPDFALAIGQQLDLAITLSPRLYAKDIEIAQRIITTLFGYESQQNSSTLVSAKTKEFAKILLQSASTLFSSDNKDVWGVVQQILLQSASTLFSSDNKDVWGVVQQKSAGTAALLQQMENFSGNLARSLPYLKRDSHRYRRSTESILPPYTILTPNIVLELHPVYVKGFSGLSYPARADLYSDAPYKIWRNISNRIDLPKAFFRGKDVDENLGVAFMIVRNIGDLLPKAFDAKIRKLKSNSITIHKCLILAVFVAELTFLLGINRTADQRLCQLIAIVLHYFFSASFSWMFVEGLHMYRRLKEKRNIDTGKMSFYFFMGWGCPAIVVGISAGLANEGYGNQRFCWMSTDGTLIWTFTIPIIIIVALNTLVFIMALFMSLKKQSRKRRRRHHHHHHDDDEQSNLTAGLRATAGLLPLIGVSFAFAILMVNEDLETFHYVFAAFTFCQGLFILVFYLILDKTKRSFHPGETAPLRSPYDFDDEGNATSTSTTEPSSSGFRSSVTSQFTTDNSVTDTIGDEDTSVPERARKIWEQTDKSEVSTTQPESSSEDEEERPSSLGLPSDSSESEDDLAPFYASDGPMHSTPMETTPEEEPLREPESESSDTGDEELPTMDRKKDRHSFKAVPEIIQDKGVSGSAATSDTTPSVDSSLRKKPLKSALKKPKNPVPIPVMEELNDDGDDDDDKSLSTDRHYHHHHHHHKDKHRHRRDRPRSRASSASSDQKEKKRRFRKKGSKKKETLVQLDGEEYRVQAGDQSVDFTHPSLNCRLLSDGRFSDPLMEFI
ncbi:Cadherin EGF LAG seven-pass G-type receptor 2 [Stylophora pistillata]|uniref:Cadherin EGF LAG seven-pass G-type receptor 2 n=1 Tax=Stylophora pistillata TaxID=50429 RepID=A0A2B4RU58_STYPI|nr:Cadherin EGF LAG seven-pass G-type receptor 2 [Stylophora pistillata]